MKKFYILAIIVCLPLSFYLQDDSLLCGQTKKQKQEKLAKKKKNQKQPVVGAAKKVDEMQQYYNYTAQENQAILQQIVILSDRLEARIVELEQISLYHDDQIADIKDCLYKKYIDSSFCPFEYFKRWFDDPFNKSSIDIKRHMFDKDEVNEKR